MAAGSAPMKNPNRSNEALSTLSVVREILEAGRNSALHQSPVSRPAHRSVVLGHATGGNEAPRQTQDELLGMSPGVAAPTDRGSDRSVTFAHRVVSSTPVIPRERSLTTVIWRGKSKKISKYDGKTSWTDYVVQFNITAK